MAGGFGLWLLTVLALVVAAPADLGWPWLAAGAVVAFFVAAVVVDYPVRLQTGREMGYVGPPWEFGEWEHVERERVGSIDVCYRCGERGVPGVASHAVVDRIQWGFPGRRVETETNYDCWSCAELLGHVPAGEQPDWSDDGPDRAGEAADEQADAVRR